MAAAPDRFDGEIAGFGTASGTRVVLGLWRSSPFGAVADAMVERGDGHRVLIAPSQGLADYIAATYTFDEVRVEATALHQDAGRRTFTASTLTATVTVGRRTGVGALLRAVPAPLARARWWARAIDPVAARARAGVHTVGSAGHGRREYYGAQDEHRLQAVDGRFDGTAFGGLRAVDPPVRFGFGSTPSAPAIVRITTTIER